MDQAEELEQIRAWLSEEGLAPDAPKEAQLCLLWRTLQHTRNRLNSVTENLETHRSQHLAEMAEVQKSLEQIRIFTEYKDILAQEIQNENDQLREQLRRHISLQDAQISEVAKMLYHQGLTELIHSSPSEQVAYLLVERASLLETSLDPDKLTSDENPGSLLGIQAPNASVRQSTHKRAPHHWQSAWKRLFGLQRASQNKQTFLPVESKSLTGQASSLEKECSRLERDLEEGSRRLAMAHNEIRHLTDELESAHLTQRAYEPELQSAQEEVEQLRQEVEKLKKCEMVELRKTKELNDRLDFEIRALRNRVRSLDADKSSLQQEVKSLQVEVERLESTIQEQQQLNTLQLQSKGTEFIQPCSSDTWRDVSRELSDPTKWLLDNKGEIPCLQHVDKYPDKLINLGAKICTKENQLKYQKLCQDIKRDLHPGKNTGSHLGNSLQVYRQNIQLKECLDCQEAITTLLLTQNQREKLKREVCETLKCVDKLRSKYHNMKEKHKEKLCRATQEFNEETMRRDERIKSLERQLSLCSHSLAKEKEIVVCITAENEKLLSERRKLLQQLNEEEHSSNNSLSLSKCRVISELSEIQGLLGSHTKKTDVTASPPYVTSESFYRTAELGYLNLTSRQNLPERSSPWSAPSDAEIMPS